MKTISEYIEYLNTEIDRHSNLVEKYTTELRYVKNAVEVDYKTLIKEFEKEHSEIINKQENHENYEFILGGDGRSEPWSETRSGQVLRINTTGIWMSLDARQNFISYVKATIPNSIKAVMLNGKII